MHKYLASGFNVLIVISALAAPLAVHADSPQFQVEAAQYSFTAVTVR